MPAHCSAAVRSSLLPGRSERKGEWIAEYEHLLEDVATARVLNEGGVR